MTTRLQSTPTMTMKPRGPLALLILLLCVHSGSSQTPAVSVRLVGGNTNCSGRVEVFYSGQWGTVCDDFWDRNDAEVVCRQVSCGDALAILHYAHFGQGSGQIWMDNVHCSGNETYLSQCPHNGFGDHNCGHYEDAGVVCAGANQTTVASSTPVRLVGGINNCSGRVEISMAGLWGTVCQDFWDIDNANVVCRQVGCGEALAVARFGYSNGLTWIDNIHCRGNETNISECPQNSFGVQYCSHYQDAGVLCAGANQTTSAQSTPVRLVGGHDNCSGRVEVSVGGLWGSVCDDLWDINNAEVVCRQVGCGDALAVVRSAGFGYGRGQIWLDNVNCTGNETNLSECSHNGFGVHNCYFFEDAGVVCAGPNQTADAVATPVRLVGGHDSCSGRVEVSVGGLWGTVCDNLWDINNAEVVCRQVGCGKALAVVHLAGFGYGTGQIWMDDVRCTGNETNLSECPHSGFGVHNCYFFEDAGVVCAGPNQTTEAVSTPVRLVGGRSSCSGRVEVSVGGVWGTVCRDHWDINDAEVVCRQIGCGSALSTAGSSLFGLGRGPIWLDNVNCSGHETNISECSHNGLGVHNCFHYKDAGVVCAGANQTAETPSAPVRLVGGSNNCSGRVEVFLGGQWGTVCDDFWDTRDAQVVCRQVGCGNAVAVVRSAGYGQGRGPIWMDNVHCYGNEANVFECFQNRIGFHNCRHFEDAGVICAGPNQITMAPSTQLRLVGGNNNCSGRVELSFGGLWGTVCDRFWDINDAQVVCRQAGCGNPLAIVRSAGFGQGRGQVWLDGVHCSGNETYLSQCQHNGFGGHFCSHYRDAGVVCAGANQTTETPYTPVRLVGGRSNCSGRVEVSVGGLWGTVCRDHWDINDAEVVCRQVRCGRALSTAGSSLFGQGHGPIWMDNVNCAGHETNISECSHNGHGVHNCGHYLDAGVVCAGNNQTAEAPSTPVRLVGGINNCSGRVEVFLGGQWGTVCDDSWDTRDAQVVCRQVGCGNAVAGVRSAGYGQGSGPIWMDNVRCYGNEASVFECNQNRIGFHNCRHYEDAGVVCAGPNQTTTAPSTQLRLVGGSNNCSGRVELSLGGLWGTVCDSSWDINDAQVVCRQAGCGNALAVVRSAGFGQGSGQIWLDWVRCSGNEAYLSQCRHNGFGLNFCSHHRDAGVVCAGVNQTAVIPSTPVRLVESNNNCSGRVEVFLAGLWGTVCGDFWDINDANVVCRQVGCGDAVAEAHFGGGSGPIWLDNVHCSGNETNISQCSHNGFGVHNCGHYLDAGVVCAGGNQTTEAPSTPVRLVGGNSSCSGRVEVFHVGHWGTVCDDFWDINDANVVCRQLGCGDAVAAKQFAHFGQGTGVIWLDNVYCTGNETDIFKCSHIGFGNHNCRHYEDAGVICAGANHTTQNPVSPAPPRAASLWCYSCDSNTNNSRSVSCNVSQTCFHMSLPFGHRLCGCVSEDRCVSPMSCCNTSFCNNPDSAPVPPTTATPPTPDDDDDDRGCSIFCGARRELPVALLLALLQLCLYIIHF